jgi:hypothetical protein
MLLFLPLPIIVGHPKSYLSFDVSSNKQMTNIISLTIFHYKNPMARVDFLPVTDRGRLIQICISTVAAPLFLK